MVHGGDTAASQADVQAMIKLEVNPPLEDESIDNFKRMEIFLIHLRDHLK